jgi:hypothetical protein
MTHRGSCHCGGLSVEYETEIPVEKWQPRACGCTFCRRHGARNVSDPAGRLRVAGAATVYRFGLGTADFLLCPRCGCYVVCVLEQEGRRYGTINLRMLAVEVSAPDSPISYDAETAESRIARRVQRWTPTEIVP